MRDQGVDERTRRMPGSWVHGQSLRLINYNEMRILMYDREGDGLRSKRHGFAGRHIELIGFTDLDPSAQARNHGAVSPHFSRSQQNLQARPADVRQTTCKEAVEPLTGFGCANVQGQMCCARIGRFQRRTALACHREIDAVPALRRANYTCACLIGAVNASFSPPAERQRMGPWTAAQGTGADVPILELVAQLPSLPYRRSSALPRSSSGQDASLSRWKQGFDSPTGRH